MQIKSTGRSGNLTTVVLGLDRGFGVAQTESEIDSRRWLARQSSAALVYVTGRTVESARAYTLVNGLPIPDVLIADCGASVLSGRLAADLSLLEADLQRSWVGQQLVRERLRDLEEWIEPQPWRPPRRVPYFIRAGVRATDAVVRVREALGDTPAHVLCADELHLDIVPAGVSRSSTLDRVRLWGGWQRRRLVVASGTAADLPLLTRADQRIVLPDPDAPVSEALAGQPRTFFPRAGGVHGVVNGLFHFSQDA